MGISPDLTSGQSVTWDVGDLREGIYSIACEIAGHKEAGMQASLTVASGVTPEASGHGHGHGGEDVDWAALDAAMRESVLAFPAETEGKGNALLEPSIVDGVKVFELTTEITPWEVEPGKFVDAWSYNGIVPGPMIKVDIGDRVRVVIHSRLPMGTDVHWHGIATPFSMDGVAPLSQPLIESGQDFVYEFEATKRAVGMFHAHHHGQMQVPNGLFGVLIVGDLPLPTGQTIGGSSCPTRSRSPKRFRWCSMTPG